ncbi:nucleotidyltransferase family protein [bacterium]|nr:nucleotidyltransferase family protein [bacterium]
MQAIVAAGGQPSAALKARGVERVPLLTVNSETVLCRVCRCLIEGGGATRVYVMAPEAVPLPGLANVSRGVYTGSIVNDVLNCAQELEGTTHLLVAGADTPLLTPESIAALAEVHRRDPADVIYPVVERRVVEARFPQGKRTYLPLRHQTVTGGNVFVLSRHWLISQRELLCDLFEQRKNLLALMRMFGLWFFLRLLTRQADLDYLGRHLSRVVNGKVRAAVLDYPELAVDLDKEADLDTLAPYLDPLPGSTPD